MIPYRNVAHSISQSLLFALPVVLCGTFLVVSAAGPSIRRAGVSPAVIYSQRSTSVLFTAEIGDASVIGKSVNLQRLNVADGSYKTIGTLYDDGTHGDLTAGDGVYSLEMRLTERGPFPIVFRVSAALRGSVSRVFSTQIVLGEATRQTAGRQLRQSYPRFSNSITVAAETITAPATVGF